ncbi:2-oxo acid dehydrogenase subunit E2 [Buchnera aphidicola]|uniref:2-oxo acid dehydrogenase subunit E2 n=1 Tax=Buchnera aphidicola TaxID=9 RepID=UPI003463AA7D
MKIKIPDIGSDIVEVIEVVVKIGDFIHLDQGLILVEGDKTSMEIPAPCSGIVSMINVKVGDKVKTDSIIMLIDTPEIHAIQKKNFVEETSNSCDSTNNIKNDIKHSLDINNNNLQLFHASPLIRKIAREKNIDLSCIKGTGPKNRILKSDLDQYHANNLTNKNDSLSCNNLNELNKNKNLQVDHINVIKPVKLTKIQISTGCHLSNNWNNIPHVTHFDEADVTDLDSFRKKYNLNINDQINKITMLSFIIKLVIKALKMFPKFNSALSIDKEYILFKEHINIGIAVDTPDGLLVPVLKEIHNKSIAEISKILINISNKAREKKLILSDLQDGTFTISNLGSVGGINFTPIINASEVAILGISKCITKPVWNGKIFQPKLMLPLSLSYDHRVINGVEAARFINFLITHLSDIRLFMM